MPKTRTADVKTEQGPIPVYSGNVLLYILDPKTLRPVGEPEPERFEPGRRLTSRLPEYEAGVTVYFIGGETGPIKIGQTTKLDKRLRALQSASPIPLYVHATTLGGMFKELEYHERFAAHRLHGEWFERVPEIEAEIARLKEMAE